MTQFCPLGQLPCVLVVPVQPATHVAPVLQSCPARHEPWVLLAGAQPMQPLTPTRQRPV